MKRKSKLFPLICNQDNLRLAFLKAVKGKRPRSEVRQFMSDFDHNIDKMSWDLMHDAFVVGEFRRFVVHDPKCRIIHACSFAERIVHHAIMTICEPVFDQTMIADTFACRRNKGRLAALERAQVFSRKYKYYLKLDIRRYFDSIDHEGLTVLLQRLFKDRQLLKLFGKIIDSYEVKFGKGVPIGTLTSQYFSNFYLGSLDRFVKESLRTKGYVRYMDDFVLWHDDPDMLIRWRSSIEGFLSQRLKLSLNTRWTCNSSDLGLAFLGVRVLPQWFGMTRGNRRRFCLRLRDYERAYLAGQLTDRDLQRRVSALVSSSTMTRCKAWRQQIILRNCK